MNLDLNRALEIIGGDNDNPGMMDLKFFPASPAAATSLALKLMEACKGDESRLRWIVREAGTAMDEYPGPATLLDMLARKYPPAGSIYANHDLGPKPAITPEEEAAIRREIADTATRLSITPKPLVKRELPPLPEHPITAADILREEARNA